MSDVTTGTAFNPQFFMNPPWWLGRVESKETWSDNIQGETFTNIAGIQGWGHRYKVRVFNWHTGELDKLAPKDMAFCQVIMPVTSGSGHGGACQTPSIESGSVVFGFFMDGMAGQEGYIIGVLGNSNNNVPKERGQPAPNQPGTPQLTPSGSSPGTKLTPPPPPAIPATGPGSLANVPVPSNVDQLSIDQLKKLLDPSKTPSSAVFKSASEARQKAKLEGLSAAEVERLVLVATVKASRQSGASAGSSGNCNQGYQQFNNTYTDGDPMRSAKVPDDRIVGVTPLSTTDAQHIETSAKTIQNKDSKKRIPLSDVCKKNNSDAKGIQRVLKNLLNDVEELKKRYNQVSAFSKEVSEYSKQIQEKVFYAIEEMSSFSKNILQGVRGYTLKTLSDQVKKISPNLFPNENVELNQKCEEGLSKINCLFNKINSGLKALLANILSKILDNLINAPLCAVESLLGDMMNKILGPVLSTLDTVFNSFNSLVSGIKGFLKQGLNLIGGKESSGSLFDALEFVQGITQFFKCDESQDCVEYNEVSQDRSALPGGDATSSASSTTPTTPTVPTVPTATTSGTLSVPTSSPTGSGANSSQPVNANIVKNTNYYDPTGSLNQPAYDAFTRKYVPIDSIIGAAIIRDSTGQQAPTDEDLGIGSTRIIQEE